MRVAREQMRDRNYFGCMMVHTGRADGLISGITKHFPDTIRPALQIIGPLHQDGTIAGIYLSIIKNRPYFIADMTVNINPTAEQLADIAITSAEFVKRFDIEPKVAMLSFSNFGSARNPASTKVAQAVEFVKQKDPTLIVDGEMQADTAVVASIIKESYPQSNLAKYGGANILICPDLSSGNISQKLLKALGSNVEGIGPLLVGLKKPVHVLQLGTYDERDVVNVTAIAVVDAQRR